MLTNGSCLKKEAEDADADGETGEERGVGGAAGAAASSSAFQGCSASSRQTMSTWEGSMARRLLTSSIDLASGIADIILWSVKGRLERLIWSPWRGTAGGGGGVRGGAAPSSTPAPPSARCSRSAPRWSSVPAEEDDVEGEAAVAFWLPERGGGEAGGGGDEEELRRRAVGRRIGCRGRPRLDGKLRGRSGADAHSCRPL
jgi:hypothetical protein